MSEGMKDRISETHESTKNQSLELKAYMIKGWDAHASKSSWETISI